MTNLFVEAGQRTQERLSDIDDLLAKGVSIVDAIEQVGYKKDAAYRAFARHQRPDLRDKLYKARNPGLRTVSPRLTVEGHHLVGSHMRQGISIPVCVCGEHGAKAIGRNKRMAWQRNHVRAVLHEMSSDKAGTITKAAGITYRQLDHWTRQGYLAAVAQGKGKPRDWEEDAVFIAVEMARLIDAGFTPDNAATIARRHVQFPHTLGRYVLAPGITLTVAS